jgi:predicted ester cyclase
VPLPYGNNVAVAPVPEVNLTFTSVTSSDDTVTVTAITSLTSPPNFLMLNGTSYDITTTATYSAPVTVCITYDPATMSNPANEQNLRLFHYNGSDWQDITTSVDTVAHKIYGQTNSLSPFAVAEPVAAPATYTITASTGPNGSILPSGAVTVRKDAIQIFLIIPNMGYHVADVLVDGVSVGARLLYIFTNVQADHTIAATFAANTGYTITASAGPNGSISPSGAVTVLMGASQKFTITPAAGYRVADVVVDGRSVGARTSYTFFLVHADHTISASFTPDVYIITATAGPNGSISPSGVVTVNRGNNATFTITPDAGHRIQRVVVDGVNRGAITSYTFTNVRKNHTVAAYFR